MAAVGLTLVVPARRAPVADAVDAERETFEPEDVDVERVSEQVSAARPVYRYSVIPGGAYNADELVDAIERDPVVAAAYRTVSADGVHAEVVPADRLAYMSYRIGDQIYWTKHQIRLQRGETILTNGVAQLRGRCGNGISLDPMLPTADAEPAPLELEALSAGASPLLPSHRLAFELAAPAGMSLGFGDQGELGAGTALGGPFGAPASPLVGPGAPSAGSTPGPPDTIPPGTPPAGSPVFDTPAGSPGQDAIRQQLVEIAIGVDAPTIGDSLGGIDGPTFPGGPTQESPSDPLPTPEPGTILLVGGGMVAAALRRLRSRG